MIHNFFFWPLRIVFYWIQSLQKFTISSPKTDWQTSTTTDLLRPAFWRFYLYVSRYINNILILNKRRYTRYPHMHCVYECTTIKICTTLTSQKVKTVFRGTILPILIYSRITKILYYFSSFISTLIFYRTNYNLFF